MKLRNKKTGYVGDFNIECIKERGDYVKVVANDVPYYEIKKECGNLYYYDTLAEFNEEWEDYEPAEPLIKDEKICKAIRAWAEANGYDTVLYDKDKDCIYSPYGSDKTDTSVSLSFDLDGVFKELEHRYSYTITELCGEEEE